MSKHRRHHKKGAAGSRKSPPRAIEKRFEVPDALERDALAHFEDEGGVEPEAAGQILPPSEN